MYDITEQLEVIQRRVYPTDTDAGEGMGVMLRRTYRSGIADVWTAVTDPELLQRWFTPVDGDLREGGAFQLQGNAGGHILRCRPPALLRLTFGDVTSVVELRLTAAGDERTDVELEHTVPMGMAGSGAGALYVGPGWDGALLGLALFLEGGIDDDDPVTAANSPQAQEFSRRSIQAWSRAIEASGTAHPDELVAAATAATAHFAPDLP